MTINTVTVIGANGAMGSGVSGIFASFGNAKVYMVSRDIKKSRIAADKAAQSIRAGSICKNLIPADYSMLNSCISKSDFVFESVAENIEIKLSVTKEIAKSLKADTVICSGTSGFSITSLSEALPKHLRRNYLGMHFFNPPYNMTLCEIIPTAHTNRSLIEDLKTYLSNVLIRTVVESKDTPAFIGNRIGFYVMNKALQLSEKYKYSGGVDYIDSILGAFTGRNIPPLATSDFVGLDVHKAIVDNIYENTNDYAKETFVFPDFAQKLIDKEQFGCKAGGGLYKTDICKNGTKHIYVYDIATDEFRDKVDYNFLFVEHMICFFKNGDYKSAFNILTNNLSTEAEICMEFLLEYIIYSLFIAKNIGTYADSADDVMATGFNWCPPLALIEALSLVKDIEVLIQERLPNSIYKKAEVGFLLNNVKPSKYDYRPYFKAKK